MTHTQDMAVLEASEKVDVRVTEEEMTEKEEIRPENIPLPTDSMITVRLSDAQLLAESHTFETFLEQQTPASPEPEISTIVTSPASRSSSRASSQSSRASATSNSVDWEGLEKTEEQEIKDDATDEVRFCYYCLDARLISIVDRTSARQT